MGRNKFDSALLLMLLASLGANVYLFSRTSHAAVAEAKSYPSLSMAGRDAPPIPATTLTGDTITIKDDGKPVLLYVLRPGCSYCDANTNNMQALAKQVSGRYRIIGLSLQRAGLEEYLKQFPAPFDVYVVDDYRNSVLAPYAFGATPSMYLVQGGKIQRAWGGLLTGKVQKDVETVLSVSLPGPMTF